jgi:putative addiction module component (TIGR02574 family)
MSKSGAAEDAEREAFIAALETGLPDCDRATMTSVSDEARRILEAAMRLSDAERAALAAVLEDSVGDGASLEEIEAAWIVEAEREHEDLRAGRTTTVPWQEVRREMFDMVERVRQRQANE